MDSITREVLDKMLKDNMDFAKTILETFTNADVFSKINGILELCEGKSKDLGHLRNLLIEQNDSESEKYIQRLTDEISFFDETRSMMRMVECGYKGLGKGSMKYISKINENKED